MSCALSSCAFAFMPSIVILFSFLRSYAHIQVIPKFNLISSLLLVCARICAHTHAHRHRPPHAHSTYYSSLSCILHLLQEHVRICIYSSLSGDTFRLLFFNSTGDRDPETLLKILASCNFDLAIFTTNLVTTSMKASSGIVQLHFIESMAALLPTCFS